MRMIPPPPPPPRRCGAESHRKAHAPHAPMPWTSDKERRLIVVSGLSGAGKSVVLHALEDLDFYSIDNLPLSLLGPLVQSLDDFQHAFPRQIAVGMDARNPDSDFSNLIKDLAALRENGIDTEIIFIEADSAVLGRRFSETRRKHPLSSETVPLSEAITRERERLTLLSDAADLHIDTSYTAVHELRKLVLEGIAQRSRHRLSLQLLSFGYKHGTPRDADFIFDVRCLPNPHWEKHLRKYSGRDLPVIEFLQGHETVQAMQADIAAFLQRWLPCFADEGRSYLTLAIGCTGGQHRSVFMVEQLAGRLQEHELSLIIRHRDL